MSTSLPERPDLDQLRRRAKELRDSGRRGDPDAVERFAEHYPGAVPSTVTLAASQLVVARENGVGSWPQLKAIVGSQRETREGRAEAFVAASLEGRLREAASIVEANSALADDSLAIAAMLGDAQRVRRRIADDPSAATAIDEVRGWPPLLYLCYSPWHRFDPKRVAGMVEVARLLLDAGASPDTNDGARQGLRAALKGSIEVNNPDVARVLLDAGANPDLGRPIAESAGQRDHRCLELLLAYGATVMAGTWTVGAAVAAGAAHAVSLLLKAMASAGGPAVREATESLPDAVADASVDVVAALLDAGADPAAYDDDRSMSALRRAVRMGKSQTAALLLSSGAPDDSTEVDHFIGACLRADRPEAEALIVAYPHLRASMSEGDRGALVEAAGSASVTSVALMIDLGFPVDARDDSGEEPLHGAAYAGKADVVRLLLDAGADVGARDTRFDATPLAFATVGSGEQSGRSVNWTDVVRLLVGAGASTDTVWVSGKPPSEEVADLLRSYGVGPDMGEEFEPGDEDAPELSPGAGVMADLARHLVTAYRDRDLALLGSLLHPDVRWTGVCTNSVEVLAWYRGLLADGLQPTVESVEIDADAIVLGLSVTRQAVGARQAPPDHLYQVFTVADAQIIEIRVYADHTSALGRPHPMRQVASFLRVLPDLVLNRDFRWSGDRRRLGDL